MMPAMALAAAAAGVADCFDQLRLGHLAAPANLQFFGAVVDLIARTLVERSIRIAGALGADVGCAPLDAAVLVHRAGGDLLGLVLTHSALERAFFDVLVLARVLVGPRWWHVSDTSEGQKRRLR